MVRLTVRVIGTSAETGLESIIATAESDHYDPDHLDDQVGIAIDNAVNSLNGRDVGVLRAWKPEVSVELTADQEDMRPSLHLTESTLRRLASAGASFDFDPYV